MTVGLVPYTHPFYSKVFLNRSSIAARSVSFICLSFFSVGASFVFLSRFLNHSGITSFDCLLARFLVLYGLFCNLANSIASLALDRLARDQWLAIFSK